MDKQCIRSVLKWEELKVSSSKHFKSWEKAVK